MTLPPEIQARMWRSGAQASGSDHPLLDRGHERANDIAAQIVATPAEPLDEPTWRHRWDPDLTIRPSDVGYPKGWD